MKQWFREYVDWCGMVLHEEGPTMGAAIILAFILGWAMMLPVLVPFYLIGRVLERVTKWLSR